MRFPVVALADCGVSVLDCEHRTPPPQPAGYPYIAIPDLVDGRLNLETTRKISAADLASWTRRTRPAAGDLLVTRRGRVGDTAPIPPDVECAIGQNLVLLRSDGAALDQRYLRWAARSPQWWSEVDRLMNVGAVFSSLNVRDIATMRIPLPSIEVQWAIADVLGVLDDKIAANTKLAATLLALVDAEFALRFGDHELALPLGDLAAVVDCLHSKKPDLVADGRPMMQLSNIRDDGLVDRSASYLITEEDYANWSRKFETAPWDLVITNVGRVGAVARIPQDYQSAIGRNMTGIRPRDVSESGSYLAAALLSRGVRREIELRTDAGSVMSALNVKSIPLLRLPTSSNVERRAFHTWAAPLYQRADRALDESLDLAATRDVLIPALMSGRLAVDEAAERVGV